MNAIWFLIIIVSIIFAILNNRLDEFTKALFSGAEDSVKIAFSLVGIMSLWLGLTRIIEASGLVNILSKVFRRPLSKLFKNIPENHPAITSITLNIIANFFGLGNAATPLGLKAMNDLQTLNDKKDTVNFNMMIFLVINTASVQLIPFTVIGLFANYGSRAPTAVVIPTIIATALSAVTALLVLHLFKRIKND